MGCQHSRPCDEVGPDSELTFCVCIASAHTRTRSLRPKDSAGTPTPAAARRGARRVAVREFAEEGTSADSRLRRKRCFDMHELINKTDSSV